MESLSEPGIKLGMVSAARQTEDRGVVELGFGGHVCAERLWGRGFGFILGFVWGVWEYFSFCYVVGRLKYKKKGCLELTHIGPS